jgi:hypothetical protein
MGWTTRVGGKDQICHREDHTSIIYLAGKTTDINEIDHKGW